MRLIFPLGMNRQITREIIHTMTRKSTATKGFRNIASSQFIHQFY